MLAVVVAPLLLVAVLAFAIVRPFGWPEAAAAIPAAVLVLVFGLVSVPDAVHEAAQLAPTIGFLAAVLVLAELADAEGVFRWLGARMATASGGRPRRLLRLVFVAAAVTTAVLSLDATVVLLTPVVVATAARLRLRAKPHAYACTHLANSASLLLPVSNLTNLLAWRISGLSFVGFAALMALPWLAVLGVEYGIFRRFFGSELHGRGEVPVDDDPTPAPKLALCVLAATLVGFGIGSLLGVEPAWIAAAGAVTLAVLAVARKRIEPGRVLRATAPLFCLFVLALGIVVAAVTADGLGELLSGIIPTSPDLLGLLGMAAIAAVLANLVNNLPATLVLIGVLGAAAPPGLVLAMLLGVNIGPNLTYVGSLATLLWRRVMVGADGTFRGAATLREFVRLGALTVPACLLAGVLALWLGLTVGRGWLG